jgi:hypothetical protein
MVIRPRTRPMLRALPNLFRPHQERKETGRDPISGKLCDTRQYTAPEEKRSTCPDEEADPSRKLAVSSDPSAVLYRPACADCNIHLSTPPTALAAHLFSATRIFIQTNLIRTRFAVKVNHDLVRSYRTEKLTCSKVACGGPVYDRNRAGPQRPTLRAENGSGSLGTTSGARQGDSERSRAKR